MDVISREIGLLGETTAIKSAFQREASRSDSSGISRVHEVHKNSRRGLT